MFKKNTKLDATGNVLIWRKICVGYAGMLK
jgi:hypothetical protein